jgi:uncharacterized protein (UPF0333 family)
MPDDAFAVNPTMADVSVDDGTVQVVPAFSMKKVDVTTLSEWTDAGLGIVPITTLYAERRAMANALRHGPLMDDGTVVAATLDTDSTQGANAAVIYTANNANDGFAGNRISVEYVVPTDDDEAHALAVEVVEGSNEFGDTYLISVSLEVDTDGSTILSTADEVKAAVEANALADALVSVADKAANDGSGVVSAFAETALSGGSGTLYTRLEG